jgi:hypothetical protein
MRLKVYVEHKGRNGYAQSRVPEIYNLKYEIDQNTTNFNDQVLSNSDVKF